MSDILKINIEELQRDLSTLKQGIHEFEPYTKSFVKNTRNTFKEFNSDFTSKMDSVIKHLSEDTAKNILENMNDIYEKTQGIVKTFDNFDKNIIK